MHDGWRELCLEEIEGIAAAIRGRKADAARQAAWRHIDSACSAARSVAQMPRPKSQSNGNGKISRFAGMNRWTR
jgi:DNA-binding GntR family transcriptional regulator